MSTTRLSVADAPRSTCSHCGSLNALDQRVPVLPSTEAEERLRADRFYEKAHEAEALATTDPLETFFLCVALGFRGRYVDSPAELRKWADRVYNRIAASSQQSEKFLPDDLGDRERLKPLPGQSILLAVSVMVSITAGSSCRSNAAREVRSVIRTVSALRSRPSGST